MVGYDAARPDCDRHRLDADPGTSWSAQRAGQGQHQLSSRDIAALSVFGRVELSDPALEMQLRDRLSFRRFAGFSLSDRTPDHSTLWRFREKLKRDGLIDRVFEEITRSLSRRA
ncbi:transposase [Mesorhizobium sp.]|uniref:transposase n=1 Tax=Mesorhizobium sp. TaxID=1871066 RepID=UPI001206A089|nr:transposase [Mesorhizobium sp.]TIL43125.1 MAG: transposase [Mesorhizobium sp.]TIM40284.1 MAG: transposase [Mesorhizobium sp.]